MDQVPVSSSVQVTSSKEVQGSVHNHSCNKCSRLIIQLGKGKINYGETQRNGFKRAPGPSNILLSYWRCETSIMNAEYDREVAADIRGLVLLSYRRVGYNFSYSRVSSSPLLQDKRHLADLCCLSNPSLNHREQIVWLGFPFCCQCQDDVSACLTKLFLMASSNYCAFTPTSISFHRYGVNYSSLFF